MIPRFELLYDVCRPGPSCQATGAQQSASRARCAHVELACISSTLRARQTFSDEQRWRAWSAFIYDLSLVAINALVDSCSTPKSKQAGIVSVGLSDGVYCMDSNLLLYRWQYPTPIHFHVFKLMSLNLRHFATSLIRSFIKPGSFSLRPCRFVISLIHNNYVALEFHHHFVNFLEVLPTWRARSPSDYFSSLGLIRNRYSATPVRFGTLCVWHIWWFRVVASILLSNKQKFEWISWSQLTFSDLIAILLLNRDVSFQILENIFSRTWIDLELVEKLVPDLASVVVA